MAASIPDMTEASVIRVVLVGPSMDILGGQAVQVEHGFGGGQGKGAHALAQAFFLDQSLHMRVLVF